MVSDTLEDIYARIRFSLECASACAYEGPGTCTSCQEDLADALAALDVLETSSLAHQTNTKICTAAGTPGGWGEHPLGPAYAVPPDGGYTDDSSRPPSVRLADADFVLRWLKQTGAPENIIGLQVKVVRAAISAARTSSEALTEPGSAKAGMGTGLPAEESSPGTATSSPGSVSGPVTPGDEAATIAPVYYRLMREVERQDEKHGPFGDQGGTQLGRSRLAVACLEDEVREVLAAWREERRAATWEHTREEVLQVAAVCVRALRDAL